jgi:aminopyrrolnitrin oxygenase
MISTENLEIAEALQKSKTPESQKPPPASEFPQFPTSWYFVCPVNRLDQGPFALKILGKDLVFFKTEKGDIGALDARCSHLGANLSQGDVVGETIRCPFHHWQFNIAGTCIKTSTCDSIPSFAKQKSYPVATFKNYLFLFNGAKPLFPLPFFENEDENEVRAARHFSYTAKASWYMVASQGFDTHHFQSVHDRRLIHPPKTSTPSTFNRRNIFRAEILNTHTRDRILRTLVGKTVSLTIDNWGGNIFVVKAEFPRACSRFLVFFRPDGPNKTHFDVIVVARKGLPALSLPIRRLLTSAHLKSEAAQIQQTEYRPERLVAADRDLIMCFRWLANLPKQSTNKIF